jgi:hypothetical protein
MESHARTVLVRATDRERTGNRACDDPPMSSTAFGILVLVSFVLPVPLLAWLDRPRKAKQA